MERLLPVFGALEALDQTVLRVKVPGRLEQIRVDVGSKVKAGEIIAQIEKRDYELKAKQAEAYLAQARAKLGLPFESGQEEKIDLLKTSVAQEAEAVLDEARKNRTRILKLSEQGIISQAETETVEAAYQVALHRYEDAMEEARNRLATLQQRKVELELARQELDDTAIRAPFEGAIQERRANQGEYLATGAPIVTLVRMNPLRLRLEAPEREASQVRLNQTIRFRPEGSDREFEAKITRVSPALTAVRMLVVEADVQNQGTFRPGTFVRGNIVVDEPWMVFRLPSSAVRRFAGIQKVMVIAKGVLVEKEVEAVTSGDNAVAVTSGLKEGDLVALNASGLTNGQAALAEILHPEPPPTEGETGP